MLRKPFNAAFALTAILAFLCVSAANVLATQEASNLDATVGVNPVFSISANPSSLNFGSGDPGTTTPPKDLYVTCVTNNNNPWSVSIIVTSELTSGSYTIPNENFNWWGWATGNGRWNAGTGNLSTAPFTFYEASPSEYITNPNIEIHLTFNIDIPQGQKAGTYSTVLVLTMTE